jgi:predicted phosphodiesterase
MRYLVISDIHANLTAFNAVLDATKGEYDQIWCLGDVVGYGPHPNECIERLKEFDHICLAGNHDWAVVNKLDFEDFNPHARFSIEWTQRRIKPENLNYLENLPMYFNQESHFTLVHASPRHPILEYVAYAKIAQLNFRHFKTPYCLVGHTHSPVIFVEADTPQQMCAEIIPGPDDFTHKLNAKRLIINPGSVGQPRDGDARAAYGILDTERMDFQIKRIPYHVSEVQELMKQHDFPRKLWTRLAFGY